MFLRFPSSTQVAGGAPAMPTTGQGCPAVVTVERGTHESILRHVHSDTNPHEIGGAFTFEPMPTGGFQLTHRVTNRGGKEFAAVHIQRGVVEFHTHPSTCQLAKNGQETCTVPLPSAADMVNVLMGYIDGVRAHLLYCDDGVYVIRLGQSLAVAAGSHPRWAAEPQLMCRFQRMACDIHSSLTACHARYAKVASKHMSEARDRAVYFEHQQNWMQCARDLGFDVQLVPADELPTIRIETPVVCGPPPTESFTPIVQIDRSRLQRGVQQCDRRDACKYLIDQLKDSA